MAALEITPTQVLKIVQDGYRTQYPNDKYLVVMFRHKKDPTLDRTVIVTSVEELHSKVMNQFQIDEHAKVDIEKGMIEKVELGYFQWNQLHSAKPQVCKADSGQADIELVTGHYIPDIFFATPDDTETFMKLIKTGMTDILDCYKRP